MTIQIENFDQNAQSPSQKGAIDPVAPSLRNGSEYNGSIFNLTSVKTSEFLQAMLPFF